MMGPTVQNQIRMLLSGSTDIRSSLYVQKLRENTGIPKFWWLFYTHTTEQLPFQVGNFRVSEFSKMSENRSLFSHLSFIKIVLPYDNATLYISLKIKGKVLKHLKVTILIQKECQEFHQIFLLLVQGQLILAWKTKG